MTVNRLRSFCRTCHNACGVLVDVEDGRIRRITGDDANPVYRGYTCTKGRGHAALYNSPERIIHPLRRDPDGVQRPIALQTALDEIAAKLKRIIAEHGPRSVAIYMGTLGYIDNSGNWTMADAFLRAIDSPMYYGSGTIDQSGKGVAGFMHGIWMAGTYAAQDPDVLLFLGMNPLISHSAWSGNPGDFLKDIHARAASLIVIDPRRTEVADYASVHLQLRPGSDPALLAGMIRLILEEGWADEEFLAENVDGVAELRSVVDAFTLDVVEDVCGVPARQVREATHLFAHAERGFASGGTGADMHGHACLTEYLILCLNTVCGHWLRAGETIRNALTISPSHLQTDKAQALPPTKGYGYGAWARVRGVGVTGSGMPTATLAEEILLPGDGQVRALICIGGNPVAAWPDQAKTVAAFESIELLVQTDVLPSATAKMAHYVIPIKLPYEQPGTTFFSDLLAFLMPVTGARASYAQYTKALVEAPPDVVDHATFIFKLAQAMGLQLDVYPAIGKKTGGEPTPLDMTRDLDVDALLEIVHTNSRVPLATVRSLDGGNLFPDPPVVARPKDPGWEGRLTVANPDMMRDLSAFLDVFAADHAHDDEFPFRLVSRRMAHVYNSVKIAWPNRRGNQNPAFVHPDDLTALGIASGTQVEIRSPHGAVTTVVEADDTMRRGTVSMTHAWGDAPKAAGPVAPGANSGVLIDNARFYDRYTGQPQMSNVPVAITAIEESAPCT